MSADSPRHRCPSVSSTGRSVSGAVRVAAADAGVLRGCVLLLVAIVGVGPSATSSWGQDVFEVVPAGKQNSEEQLGIQARAAIDESNLDAWAFGGKAASALASLETQWLLRVEQLSAACDLSQEQRRALVTAGRVDIKQLETMFHDVQQAFREARTKEDNNFINRIFQDIEPIRQRFQRGVLTDDSFAAKSLASILNAQQRERYRQWDRERRQRQFEGYARWALLQLERYIPLTDAQRQELLAILLDCEPPEQFQVDTHSAYVVVLAVLRDLPENELRDIFDEVQLPVVREYINRSRNWLSTLAQRGFLPVPRARKEDRGERSN